MGKIDKKNLMGMFRLRVKEARVHWKIARRLFWGLLILSAVLSFQGKETSFISTPVLMYSMPVFLQWGMTAALLFAAGETLNYRDHNRLLGMFPQDNRTRFWSYVLLMYVMGTIYVLIGLALYLVFYLVLSVLGGLGVMTVEMAYPFHPGVTAAGLLTGLLIVYTTDAFLALIRALHLYLGGIFYCLLILGLAVCFALRGADVTLLGSNYLQLFWPEETSLLWYCVKMAGTCLAFLVAAGFLTARTRYYEPKHRLGAGGRLLCVGLAAAALLVFSYSGYTRGTATMSAWSSPGHVDDAYLEEMGYQELKVELPKADVRWKISGWQGGRQICELRKSGECPPNTLVIRYYPGADYFNGVRVERKAEFQANVLYRPDIVEEVQLTHAYVETEMRYLYFLSPCGSWMSQFEVFRDRGLFWDVLGNSMNSEPGRLLILYPEGMRAKLK